MKSILSRVKTTRVRQRRYKAIVDLTQPRRMSATRLSLVTGAMFLSIATTSVLVASPAAMASTSTSPVVVIVTAAPTGVNGVNCQTGHTNCQWNVTAHVTITNNTTNIITINNVGNFVTYDTGQSGGVVKVTNNDGLTSNITIKAGKTADFKDYQASFKIPQTATTTAVGVSVTTGDGKTYSADGKCVSSGTPLPVGTIGGLIVVAAMGGVGMEVARRHRRNARQLVSK